MTARPLLVLAVVWIAAAGCTRRSAVETDLADVRAEGGPSHESWDMDMLVSEDGRPRFRLLAHHMAYFERGDSTWMELEGVADSARTRVTGLLYGAERDTSAWFEADRMTWFDEARRMEARGAVVVRSSNGRVLEAEHLEWLEPERRIRTPGFARILMTDGRLEGYGLTAMEDLEDVRIANVSGNVTVTDE